MIWFIYIPFAVNKTQQKWLEGTKNEKEDTTEETIAGIWAKDHRGLKWSASDGNGEKQMDFKCFWNQKTQCLLID